MESVSNQRVPVLRFKDDRGEEYPDWEIKSFSSIAQKVSDNFLPDGEEDIPCIGLENLTSETGILIETTHISARKSVKTRFLAGDVLFGKLRPYLKKYYLADFSGVCTTEIWVLRPTVVNGDYLYFVVQGNQFFRAATSQFGSKMPRSDWGIVSSTLVRLPSSESERQKIADFLSSIDTRIEQLERKKALFEQFKKGLMQKLFNQEIRFRDEQGEKYPEWEEKRLGVIFSERKDTASSETEMLSVTISNGVVRARDLDRRDTSPADKSKYKKVVIGDIPYNSMRMWQGASGVSRFNGIVSPAYTVIVPKYDQVPEFWGYYFKLIKVLHMFQRYSQVFTGIDFRYLESEISNVIKYQITCSN